MLSTRMKTGGTKWGSIPVSVIGVVLLVLASCQEKKPAEVPSPISVSVHPGDPSKAEIITSDIDLFWKAYDLLMQDTAGNPFQHEYLDKESTGLQDIIPTNRIENAETLKELVLSEHAYYDRVRASTFKSKSYAKQIRAAYYALKYVYPEAVFPPVYLTIGRTTGIGMDTENGLVITVETLADSAFTTHYGRPTFDLDLLPFVVAHEIIHFLQKDNEADQTLLKHCIREGSADFISEMVSGEKMKLCNGPHVYSYGDAHEAALWNEFKANLSSDELAPWLYSEVPDERPQNLGYWMGYQIVASYYEQATDKHQAIQDILNISDYPAFLQRSGYADGFE